MIERFKTFYFQHEGYVTSGILLFGFILDNLTFQRIDRLLDALILCGYLIISLCSLVLLSLLDAGRFSNHWKERLHIGAILTLQFTYGGLASAFFIFYSRSGTLVGSWPFLLILLALLIGNEIFKKRYQIFTFRIVIFFFLLYSFSISYLPIIFGSMGVAIFLLSGLVSLALVSLILFLLARFMPELVLRNLPQTIAILIGLYVLINLFYFTNILPPIPLSLKDAGVFHYVERVNGEYRVSFEGKSWTNFLQRYPLYHRAPGESVFVFSSVFAPTRLDTEIVHSWEYYNEATGDWLVESRVKFPIVGGADGGYRGYSTKSNTVPGRWRVDVETGQGALIGRVNFKVVEVPAPVPLETDTR